MNQKGYKLLNLTTGQYIVSKDVCFYETTFPFSFPLQLVSLLMFPQQLSFTDTLSPIFKNSHSVPPETTNSAELDTSAPSTDSSHHVSPSTISHTTPSPTSTAEQYIPISDQTDNSTSISTRPIRTRTVPQKYTDLILQQ